MLTTTTSPWRTKLAPSYQGMAPVPFTKAPPWIQTMTGRWASSRAGVWTFRKRQSSLQSGAGAAPMAARLSPTWTATGPKRVASRTSLHPPWGSGARKRRLPVGAAA